MTANPTPPVVDFNDRRTYELARRIFYRRFSARARWLGLDPDDVMQEVYLGLLRKSESPGSRWDPSRGALSTWMFTAIQGLVINLADKARRKSRRESLGTEADASHDLAVPSNSVVGQRDVIELAAEMEVPVLVVEALIAGEDVFCACMDAGLDFFEASELVNSLGLR